MSFTLTCQSSRPPKAPLLPSAYFYVGRLKNRMFGSSKLNKNQEHKMPGTTCKKCGGSLCSKVKRKHNITDVVGAAIIAILVLGFIVFFLLPGTNRRSTSLLLLVAGVFVYGLYHMIGFKEQEISRCKDCGSVHETETPAQQ